jgi:hypothetical protein
LRLVAFDLLLDNSPLSVENAGERLRVKRLYGSDYSSELDFVSSYFCEISRDSIGKLEIEDFTLILNPRLSPPFLWWGERRLAVRIDFRTFCRKCEMVWIV